MAKSGLARREMFVDARDLQSENVETGETMTEEEYAELLVNRGKEKLSENQIVESFDTSVRTRGATYEYGTDFFLGDIITVTDERIGATADAVVMAVQRSVSRSGEGMTFTFGFDTPTVFDILKRKAEK